MTDVVEYKKQLVVCDPTPAYFPFVEKGSAIYFPLYSKHGTAYSNLHFKIKESNGVACVLKPVTHWFDKIDVHDTIHNTTRFLLFPDDFGKQDPITLEAGETKSFSLRFGVALDDKYVNPIMIKLWPTAIVSSGNGSVQLSQLAIELDG